jgi:hypothetical protein
MTPTIAAIAYAAAVLALAEQCAKWDAEEIAYRIRNNGESLDHAPMWRFRAGFVGALALGLWLLANHEAPQHWSVMLPLLGFGAFAFSAWFRYRLNKRRGKDWRYIAPWSNVYDCFWMTFTMHVESKVWQPWRFAWPSGWQLDAFKAFYVENSPRMRDTIHRAGLYAYITEITITAACILWVALTL